MRALIRLRTLRIQTLTTIICASALVFIAAAPGTAQAQDCKIKDIDRGTSIDRIRLRSKANFRCLEIHIDALRAAQGEMRAEIERLKAAAMPAKSMTAFRDVDGAPGEGLHVEARLLKRLVRAPALRQRERNLEGRAIDGNECGRGAELTSSERYGQRKQSQSEPSSNQHVQSQSN